MARQVAHFCGFLGAAVTIAYLVSFSVPPARYYPDTWLGGFHSFFTDVLVRQEGLPPEHEPGWMDEVEPGDVLFMSRAHVAWGQWSHVAVVVEAPPDARGIEPGRLALLDAAVWDGLYLSPLERYADWPRVVARRASDDPAVRRRIAEIALSHRERVFAFWARGGDPFSSCSKAAIDALKAVGLDPGVDGWQAPDLLWRSDVWVD